MATVSGIGHVATRTTSVVPRTRGAVNGFLVLALGIWGATVPFFGPQLGLAYTPDVPWTMTEDRLWLNILPGVAAVLGGMGLISSARRGGGVLWGWFAVLGGAWFAAGPAVSTLWNGGQPATGTIPATDQGVKVFTELVFHTGLGILIVFLAAVALGRFTVLARVPVEPTEPVEQDTANLDTDRYPRFADETARPVEDTHTDKPRSLMDRVTGRHRPHAEHHDTTQRDAETR